MNKLFTFQPKDGFPELPYIFTAPTDWDPKTESLPLIVFLHGAGERGPAIEPLYEFYGIPKLFGEDPDFHGLRVLTLSPQCPKGLVWNNLTFAVKELIESVAAEVNADRNAITVTGCSMGGFGTWELITAFPELFAAAAPICGGGMSWRASLLKALPLRVFHGGVDSVVPLVCSEMMVEAVNKAGGHAEFTVFPGVDHNSWINAYRDTDVIEWLAAQRRA